MGFISEKIDREGKEHGGELNQFVLSAQIGSVQKGIFFVHKTFKKS